MGRIFDEQEQKIARIRLLAESGGDSNFFKTLTYEMEALSDQWKHFSSTDLSRDEHARLIQSKHDLLGHIERIKNKVTPPHPTLH